MIDYLIDNSSSILTGIIASLIAIGLQVISKSAIITISYFITSRLWIRRLFAFDEEGTIYIYSGSIDHRKFNKDVALIAGPDATATSTIMATIQNIYSETPIKHIYSSRNNSVIINENVISVGGPVYNSCTKQFLQTINSEVSFDDQDCIIVNQTKYCKSEEEQIDYGLVIRLTNPFANNKKVTIIAGCGSHGVLAAASLFNQTERFKNLRKSFLRQRGYIDRLLNNDFICVLSCRSAGNDIGDLKIEFIKKLNTIHD